MVAASRRVLSVLVFAAFALSGDPAHAWVERVVKSDAVTIDVDRDGSAVVTHELLIAVRGGPLAEIAVNPIDEDGVLEEGATVTLAKSGHAAGLPLPLTAAKDGTRLLLHVIGIKGLRSGGHLFRFAYRTNLFTSGKVKAGPDRTIVEWQGPSFGDGIDSARVVFRLPRADTPPRLGDEPDQGATFGVTDERGGVFLATSRRAADKDELEVVRPHVARGEIVSWRVVTDPSVFDASRPKQALPEVALAPAVPRGVKKRSPLDTRETGIVVSLAALLAAAVVLKSRIVAVACRARRAVPRPVLALPTALRAFLAAGFALGAVALVAIGAPPLLAAASLLVTLAASAHLPPRVAPPLRGPGQWKRLEPDVAFEDESKPLGGSGRFFDVGSPVGFVLFLSLLGGFVAAAISIARGSTYHGLAVALASVVLFPVFCTGRAGELPPDPAVLPRELLDWLSHALAKDAGLELAPMGRIPLGATKHDELRLLVLPRKALVGLVAVEAGMDFHQGALGPLPFPFVIVRVVEGSPAAAALPTGFFWSRGRTADERVAVLRPRLPTRRLTVRLVRDLVAVLAAPNVKPQGAQPSPTSATRASGKAQSAAKPGTTSSPAHAT